VKGAHLESGDTQNSPRERALFAAALVLVLGLGLVGTVAPTVGGVLTVGAWLYFVYALHRYGRTGKSPKAQLGPDGPARSKGSKDP
jgi:hypothetical protein